MGRRAQLPAGERRSSVKVIAVVRTDEEFGRAQTILQHQSTALGPSEVDSAVRAELARIEWGILRGMPEVLEEFGGLQAALRRAVALSKRTRSQPGQGSIHRSGTGKSVRLSEARSDDRPTCHANTGV